MTLPDLNAKTQPWHDDEFIRLNGVPLCYTQDDTGQVEYIALLGGGMITPSAAKTLGFSVEMPGRPRGGLAFSWDN